MVGSEEIANLIGFLLNFAGIVALGGLVGWLIHKLLKMAHWAGLNRLLGGAFGFLRGVLIAAVIVLGIMTFSKNPPA